MIRMPPGAVLLDPDEAAYVAEALRVLGRLLRERRSQPSPRLVNVTTRLAKAAETGSGTTPNGSEKTAVRAAVADTVHPHGYATVTPVEAARIIGCGPRNVRDLVRRGRLTARRSGGRWLVDAGSVEAYAGRRAAHRAG